MNHILFYQDGWVDVHRLSEEHTVYIIITALVGFRVAADQCGLELNLKLNSSHWS